MGRVGWIVDERFQNSCVGGCEISDCRVQLSVSFWVRQACPKRDRLAGPKRDRLAALLLFPFRKAYWKHNGNKSVEWFAGPPGGPNLGTLWSILAPPFLPVSLRNPAPHVPHPLPDRYRSLRRPRQRLRSPPSSPLRHSLTFHPPPHTFYPPLPTNHRPALPHPIASLLVRMQPYHLTHASLLVHLPKIFPCHAISRGCCVSTIL